MTQLTTIVALHVLVASVAIQKPVVEFPIIGEFDHPTTLESMLERSDAVVIATIRSVREVPDVSKRLARTDYDVAVTEAVKEHTGVSRIIVVCRPGVGSVEHEDRIVRRFQPGMPDLRASHDYLLFLSWDDTISCYRLAFGPGSVAGFAKDGKLTHFASGRVPTELRGLRSAEVVATLDRARRKK